MLDTRAIIDLTEPAASHADSMARLEFRHDLHALIVLLERRHSLPTPTDTSPAMQLRNSLIGALRAFEDLHGLPNLIPRRVVYHVDARRERYRA